MFLNDFMIFISFENQSKSTLNLKLMMLMGCRLSILINCYLIHLFFLHLLHLHIFPTGVMDAVVMLYCCLMPTVENNGSRLVGAAYEKGNK